jgi:hypothetical protein
MKCVLFVEKEGRMKNSKRACVVSGYFLEMMCKIQIVNKL